MLSHDQTIPRFLIVINLFVMHCIRRATLLLFFISPGMSAFLYVATKWRSKPRRKLKEAIVEAKFLTPWRLILLFFSCHQSWKPSGSYILARTKNRVMPRSLNIRRNRSKIRRSALSSIWINFCSTNTLVRLLRPRLPKRLLLHWAKKGVRLPVQNVFPFYH